MASMGPSIDDARGDVGDSWTLPNWEEYSEAPSSNFDGDWSDVKVDVSLDTASSVASTEHQRVYKLQRARGGFSDEKQRDLRDIHSLYTKRRLEETSVGVPSVRSSRSVSAKWFQPAPCTSPRPAEEKLLSPINTEKKEEVESELLVQQTEISSELQAVRRQLSDFQDKWKKTVEERKTASCDHAVLQVQAYHDERLQQVVDESLAELKLVRGRYKKKEAKLEEELRAAKNATELWKQTAAEAKHRKQLDREALEFQLSTVKEQYEHACQRYENDSTRFRDTIRKLREEKDEMKTLHEDMREKIAAQEKCHAENTNALRSEYDLKLAQVTTQLEQAKNVKPPSVCAIETQTEALTVCTIDTQTEPPTREESATPKQLQDDNNSQTQIEELTRRCRALEKLLDKKFEDTPSLSSSQRCESCHSDQGLGLTCSVFDGRHELSASRSSSVRSDSSSIRRANGKSRALARVLLGSSRTSLDHKAAFTDETTLATDEATLGAHEMWDSASFTSIDSMDDFASQRTTPRAAIQRMKSTQEILSLVRQLKHAAGSPIDLKTKRREPEPEINWDVLSKQKYVRYPPSSSGKSQDEVATLRRVDDGSPVKSGVSVFDDLLTDAAAPSSAIESVHGHELSR